jgi:hypothetical protein
MPRDMTRCQRRGRPEIYRSFVPPCNERTRASRTSRLLQSKLKSASNPNQMRAGLAALESAFPPYLTVQQLMAGEFAEGHVLEISERARRTLKTWPTSDDVLDRLVAAIEALADKESDPAWENEPRDSAVREAHLAVWEGHVKELRMFAAQLMAAVRGYYSLGGGSLKTDPL